MKYLLSFLQLLFVMVVLLAVVATIGYVNVFVVTPWLHGIGPDVDYASKISGAVAFVTPVLTVISILVIVANFISQDKARVEEARYLAYWCPLHVRPITRLSGAAPTLRPTLFLRAQLVDFVDSPHLRSKHASEVERFRR